MTEKVQSCQGRDFSMFARAFVCNVFLVAKVWYVLQVLVMSRVTVQKIHRLFATFIWGSSWERTSRTNLFRSVLCGWLVLAHLFIRQLVTRFIFLRDQSDPFLRTVIHVRQKYLPEFVVSSAQCMGGSVRGYLHEVIFSYRFLTVRFSREYLSTITRKKLYSDLVEMLLPVPLYRANYVGSAGQDVLKRVKKMPVKPSVKSFFFMLHTNTLPVKTSLHEKGIFVPWNTDCRLCRTPETVERIFIDCWDAVFHWDVLKRTLKKELPISAHGIRYLPVDKTEIPYDLIMLLSLHAMWKTRKAVDNVDLHARPVMENFIESVIHIRDVFQAQHDPPDWTKVLDELARLKKF